MRKTQTVRSGSPSWDSPGIFSLTSSNLWNFFPDARKPRNSHVIFKRYLPGTFSPKIASYKATNTLASHSVSRCILRLMWHLQMRSLATSNQSVEQIIKTQSNSVPQIYTELKSASVINSYYIYRSIVTQHFALRYSSVFLDQSHDFICTHTCNNMRAFHNCDDRTITDCCF